MNDTLSKEILSDEQIDQDLLKNINWGNKFKLWLAFLAVSLIICLYYYYQQIEHGLGVTGLNDYVSWGIYISNFVFFVATSLIGMLISSVLGLMNVSWVKPLARIAELVAVAFAMVAFSRLLFGISQLSLPMLLLVFYYYISLYFRILQSVEIS